MNRKAVAWFLALCLGLTLVIPATVIGVQEMTKVYQQHMFLRQFFMKCAKHEPFMLNGRAYGCILAPLEQFMGETEETPDKSRA